MTEPTAPEPSSEGPAGTETDASGQGAAPQDEPTAGLCSAADAVRRAEAELKKAQQMYRRAREEATDRLRRVREQRVGDVIDGVLGLVKKHPGPGLIVAAIAGFFLGRLFRR